MTTLVAGSQAADSGDLEYETIRVAPPDPFVMNAYQGEVLRRVYLDPVLHPQGRPIVLDLTPIRLLSASAAGSLLVPSLRKLSESRRPVAIATYSRDTRNVVAEVLTRYGLVAYWIPSEPGQPTPELIGAIGLGHPGARK